MLGLRSERAGVVERERIGETRRLAGNGARPGAAVLQKLTVLVIGVAHRPVGKETAGLAHAGGLNHKCGDGAVDISLADDGDAHLVQDRVGGAGHDAELVLERVPALDSAGVAAVLVDKRLHTVGERRYGAGLLGGDLDFHVLADPREGLGKTGLVGLGGADGLDKLSHGHGRELDVELLEKLALVHHRCPEIEGAGGHLQDARVAERLDHVANRQEVADAALKLRIGQAAVGHVGEGNLEAAEHLARGKKAALGVAQARSVRLGALVTRAPEKHGQAHLTRKTGAQVLGTKVGVTEHDAVDARSAELVDDGLNVGVVEEQTLLVHVVDVDEVNPKLREALGGEAAELDGIGRGEDAPARGYVSEFDMRLRCGDVHDAPLLTRLAHSRASHRSHGSNTVN